MPGHVVSDFPGHQVVPDHNRADWVIVTLDFKPKNFHAFPKGCCVAAQGSQKRGILLQKLQGFQSCCSTGRRYGSRVNVALWNPAKNLHQSLWARHEAPRCPSKGLAQCRGDDIGTSFHLVMLFGASASFSNNLITLYLLSVKNVWNLGVCMGGHFRFTTLYSKFPYILRIYFIVKLY